MRYIAQSLIAINDRAAYLSWEPNTEPDLAGYHVYMSVNHDNDYTRLTDVPLQENHFVSPLLRPDEAYYFRVSAIDINGNESGVASTGRFQLSDGVYDPAIVVPSPVTLTILPSRQREGSFIASSDNGFLTQFKWRG